MATQLLRFFGRAREVSGIRESLTSLSTHSRNVRVMLGLYGDSGKENRNYNNGLEFIATIPLLDVSLTFLLSPIIVITRLLSVLLSPITYKYIHFYYPRSQPEHGLSKVF